MTTRHLFANWKLYLRIAESENLARQLRLLRTDVALTIFPSVVAFASVAQLLARSSVTLGAQDVSSRTVPMSTGDTSAHDLAALGCAYVLVGHSERRALGESNKLVSEKLQRVSEAGMTPMLCVGESTRMAIAPARRFVRTQLHASMHGWKGKKLLLVYEPVWAISKQGKGTSCPPDYAKAMAQLLQQEMLRSKPRIQAGMIYGGSATSANIADYVDGRTFQGALPGFASTKLAELKAMVKAISC